MNILILPNSFKGSLSARKTMQVLSNVLKKNHIVKSCPLSDGGDGFMDLFSFLFPDTKTIRLRAHNGFFIPQNTSYLWLEKQKTAVIETARICGLGSTKPQDLQPLQATSFGVGEVLLHAIKKGAKKIYIGLGGVACNDGGAGIAQALGIGFYDAQRKPLPLGAESLLKLKHIDLAESKKLFRGVQIYAVADVTNPMLGPKGSARVFGPQKGASPKQVEILEKALSQFARVVKKTTQKDIAHTPSTAAAGALCAGLYGLLQANIILGADFLQKHLPLKKWTQWADLIITTEGRLDSQTLFGKAPLSVIQAAQPFNKPVLFICGSIEEKVLHKLPKNFSIKLACLSDFAKNKADSMLHCAAYLKQIAKNI